MKIETMQQMNSLVSHVDTGCGTLRLWDGSYAVASSAWYIAPENIEDGALRRKFWMGDECVSLPVIYEE